MSESFIIGKNCSAISRGDDLVAVELQHARYAKSACMP